MNLESELIKLKTELETHTYKPSRSICFVVRKPKLREIFAADFRDRIVHHVLVGYLEPIFEKKFIDQSYACRKGKGTHKAMRDLRKYISRAGLGGKPVYYLQLDIQSFFVSLKKDILFKLVEKQVKNPEILWLARTIIYHNPIENYYRKGEKSLFELIPDHKSLFKVLPSQGLPIGNLTSQFFANVYLNELDQFVKHKLKIKYYLRYVDDFVILSESENQLCHWRDLVGEFLSERLDLKLHPTKQIQGHARDGIDFVGFIVRADYSLIRRRTVHDFKRVLRNINVGKGILSEEEADKTLATVNSYFGQFDHANTFSLRLKLWLKDFGSLRKFLKPVDKKLSNFNIARACRPNSFGLPARRA